MPGLVQSLQGQDLTHLRIVAEVWGIELVSLDAKSASDQLAREIPSLLADPDELKPALHDALASLAASGGRQLWAQFERNFGEVRVMGSARLEKEQPHRHPISVAEELWYRALVGRAFFDTDNGLEEFAFLPDDLRPYLPVSTQAQPIYGRPARPEERSHVSLANDRLLDDATMFLAAKRMDLDEAILADSAIPAFGLQALLRAAGLINDKGALAAPAVRKFLEAERGPALLGLVSAWLESTSFDELRLIPTLVAEGSWESHPEDTRATILNLLRGLPAGQWWSLPAFVADVKKYQPDFQRPAGDYDSWYLRSAESGEYLRGFEHWDAVDGALLSFLITGTLAWLGLTDLASRNPGETPLAFKLSGFASNLLAGKPPKLQDESAKFKLDSRGVLSATRLTPRAARYQLARFSDWLSPKQDTYQFQITARSLSAAHQQGLRVPQLLSLLKQNVAGALPPNLLQALKRWEQQGAQGRLTPLLVLRVQSAAALKALRASRAARYLAEPIGPLAVAIKPGSAQQVLQALLELGYFGELEE
jgi:hypothetical protein